MTKLEPRLIDELYAATRRLGSLENGSGHGTHRYEHAPAECRYCREWALAVVDVAILGGRMFFPLEPVKDALEALR